MDDYLWYPFALTAARQALTILCLSHLSSADPSWGLVPSFVMELPCLLAVFDPSGEDEWWRGEEGMLKVNIKANGYQAVGDDSVWPQYTIFAGSKTRINWFVGVVDDLRWTSIDVAKLDEICKCKSSQILRAVDSFSTTHQCVLHLWGWSGIVCVWNHMQFESSLQQNTREISTQS
jgi:hypothetical protein